MLVPRPTVGRVVHFQPHGAGVGGAKMAEPQSAQVASVVTSNFHGTQEETLVLWVLDVTAGPHFERGVKFAEKPTPGFWNWPPLV